MARLPVPGSDDGTWGGVLNDFLSQEHNADGTLKIKTDGTLASKANDNAVVHTAGNESIGGTKTFVASPVVPTPTLGTQAANKTYVDTQVASGVPDGSVTATKIADGAVGNTKIANDAVDNSKVAPGAAIAQSKIANLTTDLGNKADSSAVIMRSLADAKGDLIVATANDTVTRQAVGGDGQVLVADSAEPTGIRWANAPASGETNTASNVGATGVGVFKQKNGVNFEFKNIAAASSKVTVTDDGANDEIDVDVNEANFSGIPQAAVTNLASDLAAKVDDTEKGAANGVATLDAGTKIPVGQLPAAATAKILPYSYYGNLMVSTGTFRLYNDSGTDWTVTGVRASLGTAPTGTSVIIDINKNGTTLFTNQSNRPTIAISSNTSGNVTNMDVTTIADGEYLTVDIDQVGSGIMGADLTVQVGVA